MRTTIPARLATLTIGMALGSAAGAAPPPTSPGPSTMPTNMPSVPGDLRSAAGFIDSFVAGRTDALMAAASAQFKTAIGPTSLADVRAKTIGATAKAAGPDNTLVSCVRRVTGSDGKTYELTATVADGKLAGFFVRMVP